MGGQRGRGSQTHQQQEAADRLVCTLLIQQSGSETRDKNLRGPARGRGNRTEWEGVRRVHESKGNEATH